MAEADYTQEIWKTIPDAPAYEASSFGRIRRSAPGMGSYPGRVLSPSLKRDGYLHVTIRINKRPVTRLAHRCICKAFHGMPPEGEKMAAAHNDGVRTNNRPENLRWATYSENMQDMDRHGTHQRGAKCYKATISEETAAAVKAALGTHIEVARRFGLTKANVEKIRTGRNWRHLNHLIPEDRKVRKVSHAACDRSLPINMR